MNLTESEINGLVMGTIKRILEQRGQMNEISLDTIDSASYNSEKQNDALGKLEEMCNGLLDAIYEVSDEDYGRIEDRTVLSKKLVQDLNLEKIAAEVESLSVALKNINQRKFKQLNNFLDTRSDMLDKLPDSSEGLNEETKSSEEYYESPDGSEKSYTKTEITVSGDDEVEPDNETKYDEPEEPRRESKSSHEEPEYDGYVGLNAEEIGMEVDETNGSQIGQGGDPFSEKTGRPEVKIDQTEQEIEREINEALRRIRHRK